MMSITDPGRMSGFGVLFTKERFSLATRSTRNWLLRLTAAKHSMKLCGEISASISPIDTEIACEAAFGRDRTGNLILAYMNPLAAGDTKTQVSV